VSSVSVSSDADARLRGLSCPQEGLDEEFLAYIAGAYARTVARLLLETHADRLDASSTGLRELLAGWSGGDTPPATAWDTSFGDAFGALQADDATSVLPIAARMALDLGSRGLPGSWRAELAGAAPLRWGVFLLPPATCIAVESDGRVADISAGEGNSKRTLRLVRGDGTWHGAGAERLPYFGRRGAVVLGRDQLALLGFDELIEASVDTVEPSMMATLERALQIIAEHAPEYLSWVERVVHELFLIRPHVKHIQSGSIAKYFGLVHLSASTNATAIAELLVHEASHQYFHLLCLLEPFDDGSDTSMYYSPAVRTERSIGRIGVAYHAFANILLFYDACLATGIEDGGYCRRNHDALAPDVEQLEGPLRRNDALTRVGRALCYPLIERLHGDVDGRRWPGASRP
jgi:HEXXH motif-containing protein